jgi:hypothetical protein
MVGLVRLWFRRRRMSDCVVAGLTRGGASGACSFARRGIRRAGPRSSCVAVAVAGANAHRCTDTARPPRRTACTASLANGTSPKAMSFSARTRCPGPLCCADSPTSATSPRRARADRGLGPHARRGKTNRSLHPPHRVGYCLTSREPTMSRLAWPGYADAVRRISAAPRSSRPHRSRRRNAAATRESPGTKLGQ